MAKEHLPSPAQAAPLRIPRMMSRYIHISVMTCNPVVPPDITTTSKSKASSTSRYSYHVTPSHTLPSSRHSYLSAVFRGGSAHKSVSGASSSLPPNVAQELAQVEGALACSSTSASDPLVIYISKMVAVPASLLPRWGNVWATKISLTSFHEMHDTVDIQMPYKRKIYRIFFVNSKVRFVFNQCF